LLGFAAVAHRRVGLVAVADQPEILVAVDEAL
jgi:hypothetical protein